MRFNISGFLILLSILFFSCQGGRVEEPTDTIRTGTTVVAFDESYSFLFETLKRVFEDENPDAHINFTVKTEGEAILSLLNDSCKVIVLNRELTSNEKKVFEKNNLFPVTNRFAYDAVAFIVHPENKDSLMDTEDLKKILLGEITRWNELGNYEDKPISIVFDNPNSANYHYLKDSILNGKELQRNCFGVKNNREVIDYVTKNKNAIGILSAGWITDDYSNLAKAFLKSVKVMAVGHKSSGNYYRPYQYYIANKSYPFIRSVYLINRQTRMGLGTGFVNFICRVDKGQLIVTKSGLVPTYLYIRDINATVE